MTDKKAVVRVWMQRLLRFWKTVSSTPHFLRIGTFILLFSILSLGFWIRIKGVPNLPDQQFTSNDAYLFYSQTQTIVKQGHLPIAICTAGYQLAEITGSSFLSMLTPSLIHTKR